MCPAVEQDGATAGQRLNGEIRVHTALAQSQLSFRPRALQLSLAPWPRPLRLPGGRLWKVQVENFTRARACSSAPTLAPWPTRGHSAVPAGQRDGGGLSKDPGPVWFPLSPLTAASVLYPQDPALALGPGPPGL